MHAPTLNMTCFGPKFRVSAGLGVVGPTTIEGRWMERKGQSQPNSRADPKTSRRACPHYSQRCKSCATMSNATSRTASRRWATPCSIPLRWLTVRGSSRANSPLAPVEQMRTQADRLRQKAGSAIVVIFNKDEGKVPILVALTNDLVEKGLSAGEIIKPIAQAVGGSGGGKRADMAQAGGKDPSKIADAVAKAIEVGRAALGG